MVFKYFIFYQSGMIQITTKEKATFQALESKSVTDFNDADWKNWRLKQDYEELQELCDLPKRTTIYTILRRVSSSGMSRIIDMFYIKDGHPIIIHFGTDKVFQKRFNENGINGYKVHGAGMDMGFHLVNNLAYLVSRTESGELDQDRFRQEWI